ncbi:tyrosine-type recombinase/integrase [Metaclostridioides mangenotii]|uniref:tyrosine-type recombinase/integrase n=1 Tax=Metaclostridioides mangenotii TaxID=1540 RepID=UPI0004650B37|nr:tyrosine-type recombinase/integrase [Clostridioides mangenotii]
MKKPNNILNKELAIDIKCQQLENNLPNFMFDYFIHLKSTIKESSRYIYLKDITFFCEYLIEYKITNISKIKDLNTSHFNSITSQDINYYIGEYCSHYAKNENGKTTMYTNSSKSLARKRSAISNLFKYLYRNDQIDLNITDKLNPIKLTKPQQDAIKRLDINEVDRMIDIVITGEGLNDRELVYWNKTKLRDKAILTLFVTYGLRLDELVQLNVSSFNFNRGEYTIYRKRDKEVIMPINNSCEIVVKDYINNERKDDKSKDDALFLSLQGKRMTERAIRDLVKKYTSLAMGVTKKNGYSPHKLRATTATTLIQNGFSIYDVQNLLDHDSVNTTQLYAAHKKNVKRNIINNYELINN